MNTGLLPIFILIGVILCISLLFLKLYFRFKNSKQLALENIFFISFWFIVIPLLIWLRLLQVDWSAKNRNAEALIGTYKLALSKTDLSSYRKNKVRYENLRLTFYENGTFTFNMQVPFIYDSVGTWEASGAGLEDWNHVYFKNSRVFDNQFSTCCLEDSTIYFSIVQPIPSNPSIQKLYFKKLYSK